MREVFERISKPLSENAWLAGDSYSLAEVAYAPFIERMERLKFQELWSDFPAVQDWMERIKARAAFAKAMPPPEFLMEGPA